MVVLNVVRIGGRSSIYESIYNYPSTRCDLDLVELFVTVKYDRLNQQEIKMSEVLSEFHLGNNLINTKTWRNLSSNLLKSF